MTTRTTTSVKFDLKLESLNEAFQDGNHTFELSRILQLVAKGIENGAEGRFHLYDTNGNCVGSAFLEVWED
jgi:hypothetical protein